MKILFDHTIFLQQQYGGISRYFTELIRNFDKGQLEAEIYCPIYCCDYLKNIRDCSTIKSMFVKPAVLPRNIANYINYATSQFVYSDADIIHETYYTKYPNFKSAPGKRVLTVYDMIHELTTNSNTWDRTSKNKRYAIKRADHIITISDQTKADLTDIYNVPEEKITRIYLGVSEKKYPKVNTNVNAEFILYVGERHGYKNFDVLVQAFANSGSLKQDYKIVTIGGGYFTKAELSRFSDLGLKPSNFVQLFGDDILLQAAYQEAAVFVYPSLYEGFGLPPLEAMVNRCPVIASNTSSIPEVVGDAGLYFDPKSTTDLSAQLEIMLYEKSVSKKFIKLGTEQYKKFTWGECARITQEVYRELS